MNIWNKVFLGLIFLLTIGAIVFAAQEWKIRGAGLKAVASLEKQQADTVKQMEQIRLGTAPTKVPTEKTFAEMGLEESRLKLLELLFDRKKAWFGCVPGTIKPEGKTLTPEQLGGNSPATPSEQLNPVVLLEATVTITGPLVPAAGDAGATAVVPPDDLSGVVYVFDEGQAVSENKTDADVADGTTQNPSGVKVGGSFLGIFTVDSVPEPTGEGYQVTLVSANELNEAEEQRIQESAEKSTWAIYATMPLDRYEGVFDRMTPEQAAAWLPEELRERLMNAERTPQDFDVLLTRLFQGRVMLQQEIDSSKKAIDALSASLEKAAQEDEKLRADIEFEKKRIAAMNAQREALQKMVAEYDVSIKQLQDDIAKTQRANENLAAGIADAQLRVLKQIEDKAAQAAIEQTIE